MRKYYSVSNDRTPLTESIVVTDIAEFPEYVLMPTPPSSASQMAPPTYQLPPMTSKIFYFSPENLADLKEVSQAFSTNDALCAFFWHQMTLARNLSSPSPLEPNKQKTSNTSAALFAVNTRSRTSPPLPPTYLGNASLGSITQRLYASTLIHPETGLTRAAAAIRTAVNATNEPSRVYRTIGLLSSRPNPQDFKFSINAFLGPDITMTSWAGIGVRNREWGSLGKPEGFTVPYEGVDGTVAIFPRFENGGLEVLAGLESEAMARMETNPSFQRYAEDLDKV
jgi:hypothetical protein